MLTSYAIATRYPGVDEEVTKEEALAAIKASEFVKEKITTLLNLK